MENTKPKKSVLRRIIVIIVDVLLLLLVAYFVLGYVNFSKISKDEKPYMMEEKQPYQYNDSYVTVYDGKIYKIVKQEEVGKKITLRMKLWFMKDVSE